MTDYVITGGKLPAYPTKHYGAQFTGSRATYCLERDFATFDANVQAIPGLPITVLSTSPVAVSDKFFGMHINKRANDNASEAEFGTIRNLDMDKTKNAWFRLEPSPGMFDWTDLDSWVNTHYEARRELVINLFGTPTFYSARPAEISLTYPGIPGGMAEPSDMGKWSAFCTAIATRYLGKVKYYEIWNEPNVNNSGVTPTDSLFFFSGTFAKLSEMVRRANQAIKAVDPEAKIISPPVTSWTTTAGSAAESYFTGMMAASDGAGGTMKGWVDIVGVHLYLGSDITKLPKAIDRINAAKTAAGVSDKETWDTESAPTEPDAMLMTRKAAQLYIGRSMIIQAAKGIARTIYYQYDHGTMGMKDSSIVAYRNRIRDLLMSGTILSACIFTDGRVGYYTRTGLVTI